MPILKPEIQAALRHAGIGKVEGSSVADMLNEADLSLWDSIQILADIARGSSQEGEKRRAIETAFKLHGVLKDTAPAPPQVTIIINDPEGPKGINPILLPREVSI